MIELLIEDGKGNVISHQLGEGRHILGKSLDSDIVLMDNFASRHHADIVVSDIGTFIIDAGSKNGIRINGKRINKLLKFENDTRCTIGNLTLWIREPKFKLFVKDGRIPGKEKSNNSDKPPILDSDSIDEKVAKLLQY